MMWGQVASLALLPNMGDTLLNGQFIQVAKYHIRSNNDNNQLSGKVMSVHLQNVIQNF